MQPCIHTTCHQLLLLQAGELAPSCQPCSVLCVAQTQTACSAATCVHACMRHHTAPRITMCMTTPHGRTTWRNPIAGAYARTTWQNPQSKTHMAEPCIMLASAEVHSTAVDACHRPDGYCSAWLKHDMACRVRLPTGGQHRTTLYGSLGTSAALSKAWACTIRYRSAISLQNCVVLHRPEPCCW